jgi:hypothetical protein
VIQLLAAAGRLVRAEAGRPETLSLRLPHAPQARFSPPAGG